MIKGAADGPPRYQEAYLAVIEGVEQALDQSGQLGPLTFVQMQAFVAKLQLALQSLDLLEVPPKSNPTNWLANLKARLRKLEMA